jgi:propionaldehyde dehydrogenase
MSDDVDSPVESLVEKALERITFKSNVHGNSNVTSSGDFVWKKRRNSLTSDAAPLNVYRQNDSVSSGKETAVSPVQQFTDINVLSAPDGEEGGVFATIDGAVAAAKKAQMELKDISLSTRKKIIAAMRDAITKNADVLAVMAVKETKMGRLDSKSIKHQLIAEKTPGVEDVSTVAYTGDYGLTLGERAPWGVIAAVTPVTNPSATVACNAIGMVAAGNSVVFSPHPSAREVSLAVVRLLNKAILTAGGPSNLLTSINDPSIANAQTLMGHPDVKLLVVTGGMKVVRESMKHGKKVIAAGPGNPPVVVDETVDMKKVAQDVVDGASFDNNIPCITEKELFVVEAVADELKFHMKEAGAYELSQWQLKRLEKILLTENRGPGKASAPNLSLIGRDARIILAEIGIQVGDDIKLVIAETDYEHPFVWSELMMPVLPMVRTSDVDQGIAMAVRAEHGFKHTAMMHSLSVDRLTKMAKEVDSTLFVKNGPCYDGLGIEGEGCASLTIASFTGEGMTSARHFTRERRCVLSGYLRIF